MPIAIDPNATPEDRRHRDLVDAIYKIVTELSGVKSELQTLRYAIQEIEKTRAKGR